jgi:hypothetical protein
MNEESLKHALRERILSGRLRIRWTDEHGTHVAGEVRALEVSVFGGHVVIVARNGGTGSSGTTRRPHRDALACADSPLEISHGSTVRNAAPFVGGVFVHRTRVRRRGRVLDRTHSLESDSGALEFVYERVRENH